MRRILGFGLLLFLSSLPLFAAKNSQEFVLPPNLRVGEIELPQDYCEVTWTTTSGAKVQLTIKGQGKKTITIPARMVEERHNEVGVETYALNGITYLQELHTTKETFIVQDPPSGMK
jgi:hypothetical protein